MKNKQLFMLLAAMFVATSPLAGLAQNSPPPSRTIEALASIKPAAPRTGENTFDVSFTESSKPVSGLKLIATVGMTNMDMGTAHPPIKETLPGHYGIKPMFLMEGPWRITLVSKAPKFTVSFDMTAGANKPWQPVKRIISIAGSAMPAKQEQAKVEPQTAQPPKIEAAKAEPPKPEQSRVQTVAEAHQAHSGNMAGMGHVAASLPQLKERTSYTWTADMDFDTRTSFGKFEPMVRMMTLMMVGGSGMEGMKMAPMELKFDETNFTEGGNSPMSDMADKPLKVEAKLTKPGVGVNEIAVSIMTPNGKPVQKAKISTSVEMTSMDMGTTHPPVKELGKGKYSVKATFGMAGPWRLTLIVVAPGVKPSSYSFDFN